MAKVGDLDFEFSGEGFPDEMPMEARRHIVKQAMLHSLTEDTIIYSKSPDDFVVNSLTFGEHLKQIGMSKEEFVAALEQAVDQFFDDGGKIEEGRPPFPIHDDD